jgi:Pentapeptide repeats (8 copies)
MLGDTKESPKQLQTPESGWVEGIQNLLKYGTSVAVLIYAVVYIIYWSFYTRLGVSPEEVGASYASTLLHSIGYFAAFLLIFGLPYVLLRHFRSQLISSTVIIGLALAYTSVLFVFGLNIANGQATQVQSGISIVPYRIGPIPILDVSASPVVVEWADLATPSAKSLAAHKLFFLGTTGGTSVFYDPTNAQSVRAPSASVLILALNCEAIYRLPQPQQVSCLHDITAIRLNLAGADLRGADLRGLNLQQDNLRKANLNGANLSRANLQEVDLREANLVGANLSEANLVGAALKGAIANRDTIWPSGFDPIRAGVSLAP